MKPQIIAIATALFIAGSLTALDVTADNTKGDWFLHTASVHVGTDDLNNLNPGVGYNITDNVRVGALYNSYRKPSIYGVYLMPLHPRFRMGAGLVSGYKLNTNTWVVEGKTASVIPMFAVEADITRHVSAVWFGQAINFEIKF